MQAPRLQLRRHVAVVEPVRERGPHAAAAAVLRQLHIDQHLVRQVADARQQVATPAAGLLLERSNALLSDNTQTALIWRLVHQGHMPMSGLPGVGPWQEAAPYATALAVFGAYRTTTLFE
jgi:hypothetical protein